LKAAVTEAFAIDGPAIVDAVVISNELPNLPHLDLDMIGHFALEKIKEAVLLDAAYRQATRPYNTGSPRE
jgi:pyruvate dehydrogenase (quinone)